MWIIAGLLFIPWLTILLVQLHQLEVESSYRTLYELPSLSLYKQIYNLLMATLWFTWIWFPIKERIYYGY